MTDNQKLYICLVLIIIYAALVVMKLVDAGGFAALMMYAVKKLMDMHEDSQNNPKNSNSNQINPIPEVNP